jgi:hypothetical protein
MATTKLFRCITPYMKKFMLAGFLLLFFAPMIPVAGAQVVIDVGHRHYHHYHRHCWYSHHHRHCR